MRELVDKVAIVALIGASLSACASSTDPGTPDPNDPKPNPPEANPLAMPCGNIGSGFAGDDRCILEPGASLGVQLHVGPKDYNDPAEIAKFTLEPGRETTECYFFSSPNETTVNFFQQVYRMRPGSHHLIMHMSIGGPERPEGWDDCNDDEGYFPIGGTQSGVSEFPPNGLMAPEDEKLSRPLLPKTPMKFELHFVNTTDQPILREAWVNLENRVIEGGGQMLGGIFMIGGTNMNIPPGTTEIIKRTCTSSIPERRVVSLFGHRHAHTTRFSVWATRGGERELVYEDYDWKEAVEITYNSVVQNDVPDAPTSRPGGYSGILNLVAGDVIDFECEVDNTAARNAELAQEAPDLGLDVNPPTLTFANEVYTAEMCNLFGSMVNPSGGALTDQFWSCR
jgi:hypothetical protein